jgi:hypothetical protein
MQASFKLPHSLPDFVITFSVNWLLGHPMFKLKWKSVSIKGKFVCACGKPEEREMYQSSRLELTKSGCDFVHSCISHMFCKLPLVGSECDMSDILVFG